MNKANFICLYISLWIIFFSDYLFSEYKTLVPVLMNIKCFFLNSCWIFKIISNATEFPQDFKMLMFFLPLSFYCALLFGMTSVRNSWWSILSFCKNLLCSVFAGSALIKGLVPSPGATMSCTHSPSPLQMMASTVIFLKHVILDKAFLCLGFLNVFLLTKTRLYSKTCPCLYFQ